MNRDFHEFERTGWTNPNIVEGYEAGFGTLTVGAIDALLDAAGVGPGIRVLDVATGPGYVAASAAERGAEVVGVDFAAGMVEAARERYPGIDFRTGDALALDLGDGAFAAVTINFGLLHMADPDLALAEAFRVLQAGGRIAATVWAPPDRAVGFGFALDAVSQFGNPAVPLPPGPPFFRLSEHDTFQQSMKGAGFEGVAVDEVGLLWRLASADALIAAYEDGTARTGPLLKMQTPEALAKIHEAIRASCDLYVQDDGSILLPMPCVLASGSKP